MYTLVVLFIAGVVVGFVVGHLSGPAIRAYIASAYGEGKAKFEAEKAKLINSHLAAMAEKDLAIAESTKAFTTAKSDYLKVKAIADTAVTEVQRYEGIIAASLRNSPPPAPVVQQAAADISETDQVDTASLASN